MFKYRMGIIVILLALSTPAYAYLDPGTGSVLVQGLLAGVATALAVLKLYWKKIKEFFCYLFRRIQKSGTVKNQDDQS